MNSWYSTVDLSKMYWKPIFLRGSNPEFQCPIYCETLMRNQSTIQLHISASKIKYWWGAYADFYGMSGQLRPQSARKSRIQSSVAPASQRPYQYHRAGHVNKILYYGILNTGLSVILHQIPSGVSEVEVPVEGVCDLVVPSGTPSLI